MPGLGPDRSDRSGDARTGGAAPSLYKKLEGGAFTWPKSAAGVIRLSPAQFAALFEGVDWRAVRAERRQRPRLAG
ncbi:IS66 family insertion sequence element accessory protein TnpB [Rhodobacter capsulatus]|uniref:IS66 family insertion sequence element accessory protein TnpB n=1 Tax=Rhodobacter capsulatus TaxID=1061 RepID=UPI001C31E722